MSRIETLDRLWLRAAAIFVAAFAYLHHLQFQSPYIRGYDGYYHIKFAALLPSLGFPDRFKWAAQSATPSAGLKFLAATEWTMHFPELQVWLVLRKIRIGTRRAMSLSTRASVAMPWRNCPSGKTPI